MMNANRRRFFQLSLTAFVAIALTAGRGLISRAQAADKPLLPETDPMAVGLGYKADANKADPKTTKRNGKDAKTMVCATCMFYTKVDDKSGNCQLFPNNRVEAKGYCNSYQKKQG
jgi:hypothetical protein